MKIRDRIKQYIETQIAEYVESGSTLTFDNENRNSTQARQNFILSTRAVDWPYIYNVSIEKYIGTDISHENFDDLIESYRKILGDQMVSEEVITLEIDAYVLLKQIKFEWIKENQNYTVKMTLEYSHYEEY